MNDARKLPMKLAAIVLTKTSSEAIYKMTCDCITSLVKQANSQFFSVSIVIVESERDSPFTYPAATRVIKPDEPFNFHRFLNIGIQSESMSDWYLLCNNDLLFLQNWLKEIELVIERRPDLGSLSPISPTCKEQKPYINCSSSHNGSFVLGYDRRKQLSGWCIMVKRETLEKIGGLDERFNFYFADDDYALSLRRLNILHALVTRSSVIHLEDQKISSGIAHTPTSTINKNLIPKLLFWKRYSWIMQNDKMINGFLTYTQKWGDIRLLALKRKIHDLLLLKLGIFRFSSVLFNPK